MNFTNPILRLIGCACLPMLLLGPCCGDGEGPAGGVSDRPKTARPAAESGAPRVPISGNGPTDVVGASSFDRFHLLTAREALQPGHTVSTSPRVEALWGAAHAHLAARRYRSAWHGFVAAADAAQVHAGATRVDPLLVQALRCQQETGEYAEMLDVARRLFELRGPLADGLASARIRADLGSIYAILGNHARALDQFDAAARAFEKLGARDAQAQVLASMGLAYLRRSDYGPAFDELERARTLLGASGSTELRAYVLNLLGSVYKEVGDLERAQDFYRKALALRQGEKSVDAADVLGNLGSAHFRMGQLDEALRFYERARAAFASLADHAGTANALFSMGRVKKLQGGYHTALGFYRDALRLQARDSAQAARTWAAIAETHLAMGRLDDALDEIETALEQVGDGMPPQAEVELLVLHALVYLRKKESDRAIEKIRQALDLLMDLSAGLADEHVVGVREHNAWVFDAGVAVALKAGRVDLAAEFLEHGRAGALLEGIGGRDGRRALSLELAAAKSRAAASLAAANRAYQAARSARRLRDVRATRAVLEEARVAFRALQQRIQREARLSTSVFHPVPDSLADMRRTLREDEVLVLYALLPFQAHALVVTREAGRVVWLGNTPDIIEACESLQVDAQEAGDEAGQAVAQRLRALYRLVIEPLHLPAGARRVLLSPDGPLCYVPFPLLFEDPELEIACLPSGATLRLLGRERKREGSGVLALGDPDYTLDYRGRSLQVYAQGVPLSALPATRAEVMAITRGGDARLLGTHATVRNLEEMAATRPRWSVMHFACHGLFDPRVPTLSALAVTPEDQDDGFLTALEVYGMNLPADLVVLSGCNTGRGRFTKGEGLVGLMRAFLCAGSPRIVVSLWKVDDAATQALMTRFHALWRDEGLSTSAALRQAQREIRAQPRWRHPRYWGAWVLWGLVD